MEPEAALHFRDQLRAARAVALKDGEAFEQLIFVVERLGVYSTGKIDSLGGYADTIAQLSSGSTLAAEIPELFPEWHTRFAALYELVREARNDALHDGAFARHLTRNAVELAIILEDALMKNASCARDFMVKDPVCALRWQPISSIRRTMLENSFSYLPVDVTSCGQCQWSLISDLDIATYIRGAQSPNERKKRLARKLGEVHPANEIKLVEAPVCGPEDSISVVLARSGGLPVLVIGSEGDLRGIITPFDLL